MSEWLDIMLAEVRRKQQEKAGEAAELERRKETHDRESAKRAERGQEK